MSGHSSASSSAAAAAAWEKRKRQLAAEFIAPRNPPIPSVPHPPIDPYFIIPPVDFSPYVTYEPTLAEFTHTFEVPFNSLQYFDLFDAYTSGKLPNEPLRPEAEKELDFMMSLEEAEQEKKRRQKGTYRIVTTSKSSEESASGTSTPAPPSPGLGAKSELRFEGKPYEYIEGSQDEKEKAMELEEIPSPVPDESVMRHPDNPSLYAVKRIPLRQNPEISKIIGSVYFEDEIPDAPKLQGGVLKAINDPSLPSCTAGWLYINKRGKDNVDLRSLFREYEMDQSSREYELFAIRIPQDETEDEEMDEEAEDLFADYGEIKETFTVRKRPDAQRMELDKATSEEDKELLEELKVKPELEIVCNVESEHAKLLERLN